MSRELTFEQFKKDATKILDKYAKESKNVLIYDEILPETDFHDDMGGDSLDHVRFIMAVEDLYDIEIPDEDAEKIKTMGDLHNYLNTHDSDK